MESYEMMGAKHRTRGFTLIASLLLLLLMSGLAIGLMMMVNTEGKVGSSDMQTNSAFRAAESGIEKMTSDLNSTFLSIASPSPSQICSDGLPTTSGPSIIGVTWKDYSVQPGSTQSSSCPTSLTANWGTITGSGQNAGLEASIIPVNMLVTAAMPGGQEVSMVRQAQMAQIPAFQFGVFSESDLLFEHSGNLDFAGPVHTNADLYPFASGSGTLTFHYKLSAYGNVVRNILPNNEAAFPSYNGNVYIPSANGDCAKPGAVVAGSCTQMAALTSSGSPWGDGSVTGSGSATAQPSSTYAGSTWNTFSAGTNYWMVNGNYGSTSVPGTGASKLSMNFVGSSAQPYELIRKPPTGEDPTSAVSQAREYNLAQIHVLLADDPAELPGGASDSNNVRLANLTQAELTAQGVSSAPAAGINPFGITIASGNYPSSIGSPGAGNNFTLYFAAASNAVPVPGSCPTASTTTSSGQNCATADWPYAPKEWIATTTPANPSPTIQGLQPSGIAPVFLNHGSSLTTDSPTIPAMSLCPPSNVAAGNVVATCPSSLAYPYYAPPNASGANTYNSANANAWSLIDGYLRVEYKNSSGVWTGVTNEWLALGFARGATAPSQSGGGTPATASGYTPTPNPINPNAILLLQQPADRYTTAPSTLTSSTAPAAPLLSGATGPSAATAPVCTATSGSTCTRWTPAVPPTLIAGSGVSGGEWAFAVTPTTTTATTPQSLTQYNWYPINFYDPREGEVREQSWFTSTQPQYPTSTDNSCTSNGLMNAVEIDVGNLKRWLAGSIGSSGGSVDYSAQNGYILYFSDRRGMLVNPTATSTQLANTKSGDSGLEDVINSSSSAGTPDGVLETIATGRTYSPEDVNENGVLDNFGSNNLGLGFWGTGNSATQNLNVLINTGTHDDPYGTGGSGSSGYTTNRILSCGTTGRKNWVSGARHVLRLVDGALGNVPIRPSALVVSGVSYPGGFTVASENPVYIQGNYNSSAADTTWGSTPSDTSGMASAAVIADAVTLLSNNWDDRRSTLGITGNTSPTVRENRPASANTYYRVAILGGKNMNFPSPSWVIASTNDAGIDGGLGNFLRLLEDWATPSATLNYKGSIVSLYYSTYATGVFKCCGSAYGAPTRNFIFDSDFTSPYGLPPGTPMFKDVETLSYRQYFSPRTN